MASSARSETDSTSIQESGTPRTSLECPKSRPSMMTAASPPSRRVSRYLSYPVTPRSAVPSSTSRPMSAPRWKWTVTPGSDGMSAVYLRWLDRCTSRPHAVRRRSVSSWRAPSLGTASRSNPAPSDEITGAGTLSVQRGHDVLCRECEPKRRDVTAAQRLDQAVVSSASSEGNAAAARRP